MNEMVPDGWETVPLGDNAERVRRRNDVGNKNVLTISAQYGLVNQREFFNKYVSSKNLSSYFHLLKGEFAYNKSYSIGYPAGVVRKLKRHDEGVLSPLYICFSISSSGFDDVFAEYFFDSDWFVREIRDIAKEGARNHGLLNVGVSDFFNLTVLLPPLPEQQAIASILTSVDEVIEKIQSQINKLQDLKKGTMNELLTRGIGHIVFKESPFGRIPKEWEVVRLSDIATVDKCSLKNSTDPNYDFYYIDIASVKTGIMDKPTTKLRFGESPSRARRIINQGDVLLSTVRPNLKAFAYMKDECKDCVCSTGFSVLTANRDNDGAFIFYSVLSDLVTAQIESLVAGSNYPAINSSDVKNLSIVRPPLPEQQRIASILSSIDTHIEGKQLKLKQIQALKKSVMQDLLAGKVRVTVN